VSQRNSRGHVRLATIAVCLGVALGVMNGTAQAQSWEPPYIWVNSPGDAATYPAGAPISFSATAWDGDGTIEAVAFFVNDVWYATQYSAPYEMSLPYLSPGVYTLTVTAWDNTGTAATAAITLTIDSSAALNQPPSLFISSPESNASYPAGVTVPFAVTAWDGDGGIEAVAFYVDWVWYETQYSSPYGISLPNLSPGVHDFTVIAWDNSSNSTIVSHALNVSSSGAENQSPAIVISSPVSDASYSAGTTLSFSATAWDSDGTVSAVAFYVDSALYAVQDTAPYGTSLPNAAAGVYTLTAVAWDNAGASTTTSQTLTIGSSSAPPSFVPPSLIGSNQSPLVWLTEPAWGATFNGPASITVGAAASDGDGTIAQVEFYANGTWIHTDTSSPYSFSWTGVSAGDYSFVAVARDNEWATTSSSTINIAVTSTTVPSTAVFGPSNNHDAAVEYYVLDVFPAGADTWVANPVSSVYLGKPAVFNGECRADVSPTILGLAPGRYVATVTAFGNGGSARSAPSPQFTR
jgi:hypothetical protein